MNIRPVGKRILVKLDETPEKTKSGIYMPQGVTDGDKLYGTVRAIGPKAFGGKSEVKVGDKVIFLKYHGDPVELGPEKLKLLDDEFILGVIE